MKNEFEKCVVLSENSNNQQPANKKISSQSISFEPQEIEIIEELITTRGHTTCGDYNL